VIIAGCSRRDGVSWADVSIADGNLMVAYEDQMTLISRVNGYIITEDFAETSNNAEAEGLWRIENSDLGSEFFTAPIFVPNADGDDEQLMIVADYNNRLMVVNYDRACFATVLGSCVTQEPPFVELPGHVVANIAEDDTRLYIPFSQNNIAAYNKGVFESGWDRDDDDARRERLDRTLSLVWEFETERGIWATPSVLDGSLYVPTMDHHIFRLDAENGTQEAIIELDGAIAAPLTLYDGSGTTDFTDETGQDVTINEVDMAAARFYIGTFGGTIYEIPLDFDGLESDDLTQYEARDWVWGAPKVVDGVLYAADLAGNVYALDISEGGFNELWVTNIDSGGIRSKPIVTEDFVIVASRDGEVVWLRRTDGTEFTRQDVRDEVLSDMILLPSNEDDEALVLVSTVNQSRILVAFTLDGAPRWTYPS